MATGSRSDARGSRRKVPLGPPLTWKEADLDAMTQISPADVAQAATWWITNAPRKYRRLLDAQPVEATDAGPQ